MPSVPSRAGILGSILLLTPALAISLLPLGQLLFDAIGELLTSLDHWRDTALVDVLTSAATWRATAHSLYTALFGTLISVVLGGAFAFPLALTDLRGKRALVLCFMLPMMIPPQVTALAWLQLFGPSSTLLITLGLAPPLGAPQPLHSANGIALLLGVQHAPMVFLALRATLNGLPGELIEAARLSGAGPWTVWRTVVLPLSSPGLIAGTAMALVAALGNFGIPAMLGIPIGYYTLPTLIYQQLAGFGPSVLDRVAALSLLMACMALAGIWLQHRLLARRDYRLLGHGTRSLAIDLGRRRWAVEALLWLVLGLILIVPLMALISTSLVPAYGVGLDADSLTFAAYVEMFTRQEATLRAFGNSLMLAGGAALVLVAFSLPLAWRLAQRRSRALAVVVSLFEIPFALPGVVLAIACILVFTRPLPFVQVSLYGTLGIIFVAYLSRFLVVALKPLHNAFLQLDSSLDEAARLAGAGATRRLVDILLPLVAPPAMAGGLLVFLTAVNELTVSALLWSAGNETLGVLIFNLDDGGDSVLAAAVAVVTVLLVIALMGMLEGLSRYLPRGVLPWQN